MSYRGAIIVAPLRKKKAPLRTEPERRRKVRRSGEPPTARWPFPARPGNQRAEAGAAAASHLRSRAVAATCRQSRRAAGRRTLHPEAARSDRRSRQTHHPVAAAQFHHQVVARYCRLKVAHRRAAGRYSHPALSYVTLAVDVTVSVVSDVSDVVPPSVWPIGTLVPQPMMLGPIARISNRRSANPNCFMLTISPFALCLDLRNVSRTHARRYGSSRSHPPSFVYPWPTNNVGLRARVGSDQERAGSTSCACHARRSDHSRGRTVGAPEWRTGSQSGCVIATTAHVLRSKWWRSRPSGGRRLHRGADVGSMPVAWR